MSDGGDDRATYWAPEQRRAALRQHNDVSGCQMSYAEPYVVVNTNGRRTWSSEYDMPSLQHQQHISPKVHRSCRQVHTSKTALSLMSPPTCNAFSDALPYIGSLPRRQSPSPSRACLSTTFPQRCRESQCLATAVSTAGFLIPPHLTKDQSSSWFPVEIATLASDSETSKSWSRAGLATTQYRSVLPHYACTR